MINIILGIVLMILGVVCVIMGIRSAITSITTRNVFKQAIIELEKAPNGIYKRPP